MISKKIFRSSIFQLSSLFAIVAAVFFWFVVLDRNLNAVQINPSNQHYAEKNVLTVIRYLDEFAQNTIQDDRLIRRYEAIIAANPSLSYYYEDDAGTVLEQGSGPRWRDPIDFNALRTLSASGLGVGDCITIGKIDRLNLPDGAAGRRIDICGDTYKYLEVTGLDTPVVEERWSNLRYVVQSSMRDIEPYYFIAFGVFGAIALVLFSVFYSLRRLAKIVDTFNPEEKHSFLPKRGVPLEAEPLINAFNSMLLRVNEYEERRDFFLATAAHELRTPLAVISAQLEDLPESSRQQKIYKGVRRLSKLSRQLISLVKSNSWRIKDSAADIVAACEECIDSVSDEAEIKNVELVFRKQVEDWFIVGDQSLVELAITNVLHNAIKYSPSGDSVLIEIDDHGDVHVRDNGPGIDPDSAKALFEPFSKGPENKAGHGLGLAIVSAAVKAHGGQVTLNQLPSGGTHVVLSFQNDT